MIERGHGIDRSDQGARLRHRLPVSPVARSEAAKIVERDGRHWMVRERGAAIGIVVTQQAIAEAIGRNDA